jgi:hypothetical protein
MFNRRQCLFATVMKKIFFLKDITEFFNIVNNPIYSHLSSQLAISKKNLSEHEFFEYFALSISTD